MKPVAALLALIVMLAGIAAAGPASAHGYRHGPRVSLGFVFGPSAFWGYPYPYYYYPPAYYYPPVVAAPAEPTVYIERPRAQSEPERAQDYWYYCPESQAYYPYVKQCAKGWQKVAPQPPN
jgi:hypothetical protein